MRLLMIIAGLFMAGVANAATVTLQWDANTESDLVGYNLYRAFQPCTAQGPLNKIGTVGKVTSTTDTVTVDGLYCYELTAFDTSNNESPRSNKAEALVNVNPPLAPKNLRVTGVTP